MTFCIILLVATASFDLLVSGQILFPEDEEPFGPDVPVTQIDDHIMVRLGILQSLLNLQPINGTAAIGERVDNETIEIQISPFIPQGLPPNGNCLCVPQGKCQIPPAPTPQPPLPPTTPVPIPIPTAPPVPIPIPPVPIPIPPVPIPVPPVPIPVPPIPIPVPPVPIPVPPVPIPVPPVPSTTTPAPTTTPPSPCNTDGSGLIDIRIVNKPPGVSCPLAFDYCCNQKPFPIGPTPSPSVVSGCGTFNPISVPGVDLDSTQAMFAEFPWMAVILGSNNMYIGGGVLITPKHVLTAGHKVFNFMTTTGLKVRLGEWDAKNNNEPFKFIEISVVKVRVNPFFNRANLQNNIAVLTLNTAVDLGAFPHINTACMPKFTDNFVGQRCWVAGWGKDAFGPPGNFSYILRKVDVSVLDSNDCENRLRQTRLSKYFQLSRSSFVCAGGEAGKDACSGDGGSPMVCITGGRAVVVGLVAWGIGCASEGIPGVYVNVRSYIDWINFEIV